MDRSSLNRVESTYDYEKRLAFKAKLTEKLEEKQSTFEPVVQEPFSIGQKVNHPDLGDCTVYSINSELNEIVLDVDGRGDRFTVALSAVKTKLSPVKQVVKDRFESAFIGDVIDRSLPARPDVAYRQVDNTPVKNLDSSHSIDIPIGINVWHPELGSCTVLSVNKRDNKIVLSSRYGDKELVLSSVGTKLRIIENGPEAAPLKPLKREEVRPAAKATVPRNVSVILPPVFNSWSLAQKFSYLTRNQHLTTEEANDTFLVLDGKSPRFYQVEINWKDPEPLPEVKTEKVKVEQVINGFELIGRKVWHEDFGECSVSDVTKDEIILQTKVGLIPFVSKHILHKLVPMGENKVERAPKDIKFETTPKIVPVASEPVELSVSLPTGFGSWRELDQFNYLNSNARKFTPEVAQDLIAFVSGKPVMDKNLSFNVEWVDVPVEHLPKRQVVKAPEPKPIETDVQRIFGTVVNTSIEEVSNLSVVLPEAFKSWKASDQYIYLSKTKKLTPEESHNVMFVASGGSLLGTKVVWGEPGRDGVSRTTEKVEMASIEEVVVSLSLTLPQIFTTWTVSDKYAFLSKNKGLTLDEADGVMASISGNTPKNNIQYDILWSE